jgi:TonB family protein
VPLYHDETQADNHLERSTPLPLPLTVASLDAEVQRKRMLIALGILLLALAAVVLKDWDFWFPPSAEAPEAVMRTRSRAAAAPAVSTQAIPAPERKLAKSVAPAPTPQAPFSATSERAALPELQVEVVAGNHHVTVPAKSNAIHLDVDSGTMSSPFNGSVAKANAPGNAVVAPDDHVALSPLTAQNLSVSVPPDYPLLARQMKVQGVVSLRALISRDGTIQELQILSGPDILATAAREAVKQWHFKPYLQNGQPVETQARITVNFTISTN